MNSQATYGYPISVGQAVPAKWNDLYFSICLFSSDAKYGDLFVRAVDKWKEAWPHFEYSIQKNKGGCDINVKLTEHSVGPTKDRKSYGTTKLTFWTDRQITNAEITIPTQTKKEIMKGEYCCIPLVYEVSEKQFYLTALHEFGHALGLAHPRDDGEPPFDVMSTTSEHSTHVISSVSIAALDKIYGTMTEAEDHLVEIIPSVRVDVKTDRDSYVFDDSIRVSGKVSDARGTGIVMILRLLEGDPAMSLHDSLKLVPDRDGSFALDIELRTDKSGPWVLLVQYLGVSKSRLFDVEEVPYQVFAETDKATYSVGETVRVNGNVTRYGESVAVDIINPDGIKVAHQVAPIASDKQFDTKYTLQKSRLAIKGEWVIRLAYAETTNDVTFNVSL